MDMMMMIGQLRRENNQVLLELLLVLLDTLYIYYKHIEDMHEEV